MDHVERASVIAMFRKKMKLQIRISRSILGVGQKIEYLGPSLLIEAVPMVSSDYGFGILQPTVLVLFGSIQYFPDNPIFTVFFYRENIEYYQ